MDKITKNSCVPAIRFKGFTDTWEQRKFSDFTFPAGERNKDDLDLEPFAITNNQGFIAQSEAHDDFGYMKDVDRKMYIVVKPNSFAYNPARINVGSLGYYEGAENVIVSSLYEVFQTAEYVDDKFLKHWFKTKAFQDWIERLQEGSVRLYFYYDKLCECIMSMPSVEEQRKIGAYLDKIDNLITLHQRKLDKLHNVKKSLLEKMFPKNGADKPEIRFKGFTHAWEQRKLGDIGETYTGLSGKTKEDFGHGNAKFVTYMNVFSNSIADSSMTESVEIDKKQNEVKYGDVFFTTSSETPDEVGMSSVWLENGENTYLNSFCFGYRPSVKINPYYMAYMLRSDNVRKNIVFLAQGISRYNISKNKMMEISVPLPALEEQQRIGEYFRNLDTLITLHQRK